ncbi:hypothetical protein DRO97_02000 [Archaeoglobales archaeon]|nr:MAG: hypothetical protein DRO97_02000 [Archaeoglobales archaeon]
MSELERIGRLMLYRNRILEKLLREMEKEFPNMEVIVEEFERLLEAINDLDDETIHTIAKLKEKRVTTVDEDKEGEELEVEEEIETFEEWFVNTLNSLNGSDSMKNYLMILKQMGGVALSSKIMHNLGMKKNTISMLEKELEERGIVKSLDIANRKVVYFNHPSFTNKTASELLEGL